VRIDQDPEIRRVLAHPGRARIYEALVTADEPRDIDELVEASGLHANTVRWHLDKLAQVRLVERANAPSAGPGRPRAVYRAVPLADSAEEYRLLAGALADALVTVPDGGARAEVAGYELGRKLMTGRALPGEAAARITRFLARQGFEPVEHPGEAHDISMYRCPFLDVVLKDDRHQAVVCGLHHGLVQGALDGMGGAAAVEEFTPFKTPHSCLVRIRPAAPS